jgi:hypothetical protein
MSVNALLVSQDVSVHHLISSLLHDLRIETRAVTDLASAQALLQSTRFAAIMVDYDFIGAEVLLENLASSPSSRSAITFALVGSGCRKGLPVAHFALSKPLNENAIRSTLNVASHMIFSSYRRAFRCPIDVAISLVGLRETFWVRTINISMGGIAVQMVDKVSCEDRFTVRFQLPNKANIQTEAKVVWTDGRRAALRFTDMGIPSKSALSDWVDTEIQQAALTDLRQGTDLHKAHIASFVKIAGRTLVTRLRPRWPVLMKFDQPIGHYENGVELCFPRSYF